MEMRVHGLKLSQVVLSFTQSPVAGHVAEFCGLDGISTVRRRGKSQPTIDMLEPGDQDNDVVELLDNAGGMSHNVTQEACL